MISFIVEGKPQSKARARTFYNERIGKMQSATPQKTKSYEDLIRWKYVAAGGRCYADKPLQVDVQAVYPIPTRFNKADKNSAAEGHIRPTTKPDCDNIIKVVLDALNGVAYYDDKQVVCVSCNKYYGKTAYIKITIKEL